MFTRLLLLWIPFSITAVAAVLFAFIAVWIDERDYADRVLIAMDKLGAAVFGWEGTATVSAECGSRNSHCRICKFVRWLFVQLKQPTHCEDAARKEGLL